MPYIGPEGLVHAVGLTYGHFRAFETRCRITRSGTCEQASLLFTCVRCIVQSCS